MTKNQIIEKLFISKNFNECLAKMEPDYLRNDLKAEVLLIVCEMPEEKVIGLHNRRELEFFVSRIITNQIKSKTSKFYRTYRMAFLELNTSTIAYR